MIRICDAHCDTISALLDSGQQLSENNLHVSLETLKNYSMQFFACWVSPDYTNDCYERCNSIIDKFNREYEINSDRLQLVRCAEDIGLAVDAGRLACLLTIEGGDALAGRLENLQYFYNRGVRLITLTWNGRNELADGIGVENAGGLTGFGKSVVHKMNKMGMIIDVSHLSDKGFYDVASISSAPFMATHSNAHAVCGHRRNLTDEQIMHIIKTDGYIGINFCPVFLSEGKADIDSIMRHIEYILSFNARKNLGFGADFDGIEDLPAEICGAADVGKIIERMLKSGYSEGLVRDIAGNNLIRATKKILNNSKK